MELLDATQLIPKQKPPQQLPNVLNGLKYPTNRPPFFAHWFIRKLGQTVAANEIGETGCWLLTQVALTEDIRRYQSPPTFYNGQLMSLTGMGSENKLIRVRKLCVKVGLLHYEASVKRRAGTYWVEVPIYWDGIPDKPMGEETDSPPKRRGMWRANGGESGGQMEGNVEALLSCSLSNTTTTNATAVAVGSDEFEIEKQLLDLGLAKARETIRESLSNGTTLEVMREVITHYSSRPGAWGPGALRRRLTLGNAQALASAQGWPPASSRETEIRRKEAIARDRHKQQADAQSSVEVKLKDRQLELQFGLILDATPQEELTRMVSARKPYLLDKLQRYGVGSRMIRPSLLGMLAEAAEASR